MVPLAAPALATTGVLAFLGAWNDLLIGLLFLPDPEMRTVSVAVASLEGVRNSNLDLVLTGSLLSAVPPVIDFIAFQRYLVSGITAGINK
jgi:multiple sugar transport system permease protein/raffinose/stachyose/melibiose transport system permease protein